ncbi:TonB-dependent receptor [Sphingomonas oleivorans]|uniref:TonB-dependent receptor n=1 Tax=Sphingomonas oleivorans TaxID=1735121 RepID=A0A2T5FZ12_9SPHN|nr:TonB-dependent receptor [Sphingomonas oleivorans]PTQ11846.1 TonB-dependent receptor [Sphingomonas oleivorans]
MFRIIRATPLSLAAGISLLAFAAGSAQAQSVLAGASAVDAAAANSAGSAPTEDGLSDVVVTAERRDINLQQAPLTVSAITADQLEAANITDITGLNGSVPGLVVARSGGGERIISIRGIGSETPENTNTQPGVSYHIDGVYIFNSIAASAAFIDVAQVEVLRGPQGTMFGQGSTGGTINVVTNQPRLGSYTGSASLGLGNYDYFEGDAALNVPIGQTFAVRGAIQHLKHDGYASATGVEGTTDYELDDADETGWRLASIWAPTDKFSITLNTIQYDSDTHGPAQKNILDPNPDPRELTQDYPGRSVVDTELYSAVVKWETPWATFKSISSYQDLHSEQAWDADGLTADLFYALTYSPLTFGGDRYDHVALWQSDTKSYTQEFNVSSSNGPLQWILGGVYLHSKNSQYIVEYRANDDNIVSPPLPLDTPWNDPLVDTVAYAELSSITREAWAAYFQGSYDLTDQLSITAGLRYNHDQYSGKSASNGSATSGNYLNPEPTPGLTTKEVTGKLALDYQFTPSNMVYVSYTRGFKPGGINSSASNGGSFTITPTYKPETVDSFEIGSKNRFLNNTLQLNASAFLYNYHDMQFLEEDPILYGEGTSNAPGARIYGLELEGSWLVTDNWRLEGSVSLLEGEFNEDYYALDPAKASAAQIAAGYPGYLFWTNFFPAVLARDAARANINGNSVPKLPDVQGSASLTYTNQVGPGQLTARAQYLYRGEYQYRLFNESAYDTTPSYSQVNLFLRYEPEDTNLNVTFRVTNLFDKDGVNSRFSDPYGSAQTMETYIPPRQFIASIGYRF